jgi:hypothetical protein
VANESADGPALTLGVLKEAAGIADSRLEIAEKEAVSDQHSAVSRTKKILTRRR